MGLYKANYTSQSTGITFPEVYATISSMTIIGTSGIATFNISTTRDNSLSKAPIEQVRIQFNVDRNESPFITAYREATSQKEVKQRKETRIVDNPFFGWENDI